MNLKEKKMHFFSSYPLKFDPIMLIYRYIRNELLRKELLMKNVNYTPELTAQIVDQYEALTLKLLPPLSTSRFARCVQNWCAKASISPSQKPPLARLMSQPKKSCSTSLKMSRRFRLTASWVQPRRR